MVRRPGPTHLSPLRVGGGEERGWHTNTTPSEGVGDRGRGEGGGRRGGGGGEGVAYYYYTDTTTPPLRHIGGKVVAE